MKNKVVNMPLLSICIPTLNRAEYLDKFLNSIVTQDVFFRTSFVEVVISDNHSTDNTGEVVKKYIKQFGDKIRYIRTDKQVIAMDNFYNVLNAAKGDFLKLCNDTCEFCSGDLDKMVDFIYQHQKEKPLLFFIGKIIKQDICCKNLDDFIKYISYYSTWSPPFGLWKEDRKWIEVFRNLDRTHIAQTYVLCKMISEGRPLEANSQITFNMQSPPKKGGYNIAEVFGHNYLNILKEFVNNGSLSKKVYETEKKKILLNHINYFYFDINNLYAFDKTGYFKWLWNDYKGYPYFYIAYFKILMQRLLKNLYWFFSIQKRKDNMYKHITISFLGIRIKFKKTRKVK